MKKFLLSIFAVMLTVLSVQAEEATLSFANKAQRTSFSNTQQVWAQNGITFTNNKASSSSAVADYANPVRLYQSSEIVVECSLGNITSIVFDCNSGSYATALGNSISGSTVNSDKVTVTLDGSINSFSVASLSKQVRLDALTVTYAASTGVSKPMTPTLTAGDDFVGSMEVEISCATEGATIYYTTDGSEPTEESDEYSVAFEITETTTVKAIAVNEGGASNVATAVYKRVAATPEISFNGEATFEETIEVTITAAEGTTAYYTLNGKTPTENSDECPEALIIKADATLQVIAYDEDGYASPVVKQVFKKAASGAAGAPTGTATLVEDAADLVVGDKVVIVAAESDYALSTTQNTNNRGAVEIARDGDNVTLNDAVQVLTIENGAADGQFAFQTGEGYLYAASTSSNHLKTGTTLNNKASFTISIKDGVATIKADQDGRNWLRFNATNNPKIFSCYTSGQENVSIYKVNLSSVEDYVLNVTNAGWATMYLGYDVVIPEDVNVYYIAEDAINNGSVTLTKIENGVIPANTGVIVEAEAGEYNFAVADGADAIANIMLGTAKNEYITAEAYVLAEVEGEVGLCKAAMNGGVWLNNANKAYLPASKVPAGAAMSASLRFDFGGTTGVENVEVENEVKAIYDLTGRKVETISAPGIYIINGVKRVVR